MPVPVYTEAALHEQPGWGLESSQIQWRRLPVTRFKVKPFSFFTSAKISPAFKTYLGEITKVLAKHHNLLKVPKVEVGYSLYRTAHFRIMFIMLSDYNDWCINAYITLMLQPVKVELIFFFISKEKRLFFVLHNILLGSLIMFYNLITISYILYY